MRRRRRSCLCHTCLNACFDRKECKGSIKGCEKYSEFQQLSIFEYKPPGCKKAPRHPWSYYGISEERYEELKEGIRSGRYVDIAESAAMQADEKIAGHILKSILQNKGYDKIEFDPELGRICVCKTDFYGIRRYFYYLFDQELKNRANQEDGMVKVICDRCGNEVQDAEIGYIAWNFKKVADGELMHDNPFEFSHFCVDCMNKIAEFIRTNDSRVKKAKVKAKEAQKAEKPCIDIGKILALKKAGWSIKSIAEEMEMTPRQVSDAIYYYKLKLKGSEENAWDFN